MIDALILCGLMLAFCSVDIVAFCGQHLMRRKP